MTALDSTHGAPASPDRTPSSPSDLSQGPGLDASITLVAFVGDHLTVRVDGTEHTIRWSLLDGPYAGPTTLDADVLAEIEDRAEEIAAMRTRADLEWLATEAA